MFYLLFSLLGAVICSSILLPLYFNAKGKSTILSKQIELFAAQKDEENSVLTKLTPIKDVVDKMQTKIEQLEKDRTTEYTRLTTELGNAKQQTENLRTTTNALATALKSNQTRGQWGEVQLRRIVEAAGMTEHISFDTQVASGANNENRPDMIIHLPEGRTIILDAKAPANHYIEACAISEFASIEELKRKDELLAQNVKAMKIQIDKLSSKSYWEQFNSPDFVIMFVPNEAMLSSALETDTSLLEYAFNKKVALASPVSLFSVLKTVAYTWQQQAISDNAKELGELSVELLKRVSTLAKHSSELANYLEKTVDKYNDFAKSLERNVLTQANKIAEKLELSELSEPKLIHFDKHEFTKQELLSEETA